MSEGRKGSSRKLSRVSTQEVEELNNLLLNFFKKYCQGDDGMSSGQLQSFAEESGLCDKKMSTGDVGLVFQSVKLGKKNTLNFDRFQEAIRKMAIQKEITYQEIINEAASNTPAPESSKSPPKLTAESSISMPEGTSARKDSSVRLGAFTAAVPANQDQPQATARGSKLGEFLAATPAPQEGLSSDSAPAAPPKIAECANKANTLFKEGRLEEALAELQQALAHIQNDGGTEVSKEVLCALYTNQGAILQKLNRLQEADEALKQAILQNPSSLQLQHNRGVLNRNLSNLEGAKEAFQAALALDDTFKPSLQGIMETYCASECWKEAEEVADKLLALDPVCVQALRDKGFAALKMEQYENALQVLKQCMDLGENSEEVVSWSQVAMAQLGIKAEAAGDSERALSMYSQAIELAQDQSGDLMLSKALLLQRGEQIDQACKLLKDLIAMESNNSNALAALGNFLVQKGDLVDAISPLEQLCSNAELLASVNIMPQSAVRYNYGVALLSKKDTDGAKEQFKSVLESEPGHEGALKGLEALNGEPESVENASTKSKIENAIADQTQMLKDRQQKKDQDAKADEERQEQIAKAEVAVTQQEESGCFPYAQLQNPPFPAGVDKSCREQYLTTDEFQAKFGMTKADFAALPKWKQTNKKKALSLF